MGIFGRFRRSIRIAPGIRASLGRPGVSSTAGPRGASAYAGGTRDGRRTGFRNPAAGNAGAGRAGAGFLGVFGVMVLAGFCWAGSDGSGDSPPYASLSSSATAVDTTPSAWERAQSTEVFHAHGEVNVRSGPGKSHSIVRTLSRGESIRLGPADANGWAELLSSDGTREGYVYRASKLVRTSPPPERTPGEASTSSERARSSRSSAESRGYYTGPRGGCYTYTASGRKRYVDRSYCD